MLLKPDEARQIASQIQEDDTLEWKYQVVDDPAGTGLSYIEVTDEDGFVLGKL